jgi:hypothetical protein
MAVKNQVLRVLAGMSLMAKLPHQIDEYFQQMRWTSRRSQWMGGLPCQSPNRQRAVLKGRFRHRRIRPVNSSGRMTIGMVQVSFYLVVA